MSTTDTIRELEPGFPAPGTLMRFFIDDSKSPDDIEHRWVENTWDPSIPDTAPFKVPLHWHKYHDEYLEVLEGAVNIYYDGKWQIITPETGKVFAPKGMVHGFKAVPGVKMVLKETVDPVGDYKFAFFRDMGQRGKPPTFWLALRVFYDNDVYPWVGPKWLDWMFITVFGGIAKLFEPPPPMEINLPKPNKE